MTKPQNPEFEFEERLYQDYALKSRARLIIILSAILGVRGSHLIAKNAMIGTWAIMSS